jgi:hypothetical protein
MTQPAVPDSADWQRRWTIDAGRVTLQPVTRRIAQAVLDGGPITRSFEKGSLHDRIPQAMRVAIGHIDSGAAAVLPIVWLVVRRAGLVTSRRQPESCAIEAGSTRCPARANQS